MPVTNTAKGTRDFGAEQLNKRDYLFGVIREVYKLYGFSPLETPAMENIETLTGKYGDEGDQLLFRIMRSGDFLKSVNDSELSKDQLLTLRKKIADKGLRYDLTIPFARYVAKNHQLLGLPYKRFQLQPVWRADRPARGRYREFYQCDADVAGSDSLLSDAEFIGIVDAVFSRLNLPNSTFKINNRKILAGLAQSLSVKEALFPMTTAMDKLDKIGLDKVIVELEERGFVAEDIAKIKSYLNIAGSNDEKLNTLSSLFPTSEEMQEGVNEIREVLSFSAQTELTNTKVEVDLSLARGLSYYTGTIYEVTLDGIQMGSVASGGRYDKLCDGFGAKGIGGVGLSFGAERIYDVMEQLDLFPEVLGSFSQVLVLNLDDSLSGKYFELAHKLRSNGIRSELYIQKAKIGKQMKFAEKKQIPYVIIAGEEELTSGLLQLKNLSSGDQQTLSLEKIIETLK